MPFPVLQTGDTPGASNTSLMAPRGVNLKDISQLLTVENSLNTLNYIIEGDGKLRKREGSTLLYDTGSSTAGSKIVEFTEDILLYAYGTTLAAYTISTDTSEDIKTDFSTNDGFDIDVAGDYAMVVNGVDPLTRVYRQITASFEYKTGVSNKILYTSQTGDFTNGEVITGAISGATATITADDDDGVTGTLTVTPLNGTAFQIGETITDPITGSATISQINPITEGDQLTFETSGAKAVVLEVTGDGTASQTIVLGDVQGTIQNGENAADEQNVAGRITTSSVLTWNTASVGAAPVGSVVKVIGKRLAIGNTSNARWRTVVSDEDDGSNPPYTSWGTTSSISDGDEIDYRNAGEVTDIESFGPYHVVHTTRGWYAFYFTTVDSGGSLVKYTDFIDIRMNAGGATKAISTDQGMIAISKRGIERIINLGSEGDLPIGRQVVELTNNAVTNEFWQDFDFSDAAIVEDKKNSAIYVACRLDSETNNTILAYFYEQNALGFFRGLNINDFVNVNHTIYAIDSTAAKIYQLFDGNDDDGLEIETELYQEVPLGSWFQMKILQKFIVNGQLHDNSEITIDFDVMRRNGKFDRSVKTYTWTAQNLGPGTIGYSGSYSQKYGGDGSDNDLINSFEVANATIRNFQRLRVRFSSNDLYPHRLEMFSVLARPKTMARSRSGMSLNT